MPNAVDSGAVDALVRAVGPMLDRGGRRAGARNLLGEVPEVRALAGSAGVYEVVKAVLGAGAFAVRGLLFDKTPGANWKVPWHQDLTIAVRGRREVAGFGPWSEKEGVAHVQPPAEVLARMVTVRVHLDECNEHNGPLRVIPGSHRSGRLSADEIALRRAEVAEVVCPVGRGGIVVFRPLLLHASSPAVRPAHRRVVHLEFAADELPGGLEWYDRVG